MDAKEELKDIAEFVVDLLTKDKTPKQAQTLGHTQADPAHVTTHEDLSDALDHQAPHIAAHGPVAPGAGVHSLVSSPQPTAAPLHAATAPPVVHQAPAPAPQPVVHEVVRNVVHERVVHDQPQVTHVTEQHTTNNFLREGDKITDNRTINNISANGHDINIDVNQQIKNNTVNADHGGVAAGGNIDHSAVNTGKFQGVQSAGDVDANHATVGDGNTVLNGSHVGALSEHGDATNANGHNVNLGDGDITDVDNKGGQVAVGDHNDLRGDVDIDMKDVHGNTNLGVGDHNGQRADQDNSESVRDSGNTDNSVNDSANTKVTDSGNDRTDVTDSANTTNRTELNDNDDASQHDSNNTHESTSVSDASHHSDNDRSTSHTVDDTHHTSQTLDVLGDHDKVDAIDAAPTTAAPVGQGTASGTATATASDAGPQATGHEAHAPSTEPETTPATGTEEPTTAGHEPLQGPAEHLLAPQLATAPAHDLLDPAHSLLDGGHDPHLLTDPQGHLLTDPQGHLLTDPDDGPFGHEQDPFGADGHEAHDGLFPQPDELEHHDGAAAFDDDPDDDLDN